MLSIKIVGRSASLLLAILAGSCGDDSTEPTILPSSAASPTPSASPTIDTADHTFEFRDVSTDAGINYIGKTWGVAWGDANGDGFLDLWSGNHGNYVLWINARDGTFRDATTEWLMAPKADGHGAAWADFDNDGDEDLFETVGADRGFGRGNNRLFVNANGKLVDRGIELGVNDPEGRGRLPLWFDFDNDGNLDVLVVNYELKDRPSILFRQENGYFRNVNSEYGIEFNKAAQYAQIAKLAQSETNLIIHGYPFTQRIYTILKPRMVNKTLTYSFTGYQPVQDSIFYDLNGDLIDDAALAIGDLRSELMQISSNELRIRINFKQDQKEFRFRSIGDLSVDIGPPGLTWWSPSNIFIDRSGSNPKSLSFNVSKSNLVNSAYYDTSNLRRSVSIKFDPSNGYWSFSTKGDVEFINIAIRSNSEITDLSSTGISDSDTAFSNRVILSSQGVFSGSRNMAAISARSNCFSVAAGDFDNDADIDLYFLCTRTTKNEPNMLFLNDGYGNFFLDPSARGAQGSSLGIGDSAAVVDYNNDGYLDLLVSNGQSLEPFTNGPLQLFRNTGNSNHWLKIHLIGKGSNRDGIGAVVYLTSNGKKQMRVQAGGLHRGVQDDTRLHFGLGSAFKVDNLEVIWPSGERRSYAINSVDRIVDILE